MDDGRPRPAAGRGVTLGAALAADLVLVTEAVDDPVVDVAETVRQLTVDSAVAVPSFLGLTVMTAGGRQCHRFTVLVQSVAPGGVGSSVLVPATDPGQPLQAIAIILYATAPGAFVDLAADLAWTTGLDPEVFALDRHLEPAPELDTVGAVLAQSSVDQAIGALIGTGLEPDAARAELAERARSAGTDLVGSAVAVLDALEEPPVPA